MWMLLIGVVTQLKVAVCVLFLFVSFLSVSVSLLVTLLHFFPSYYN